MSATKIDTGFAAEIAALPGGERIAHCIQCGSCSGSCPSIDFMEHSPRQLFAMIRSGMRDEVLSSTTPWVCASCYTCYVRCPKSIRITDVMYALKRLAMKEGRAKPETRAARRMADGFVSLVHRLGRNSETKLMRKIYMDPRQLGKLFRDMPIGIKLLRRGRMPIFGKRISSNGRKQLKSILDAVEKMEGL